MINLDSFNSVLGVHETNFVLLKRCLLFIVINSFVRDINFSPQRIPKSIHVKSNFLQL